MKRLLLVLAIALPLAAQEPDAAVHNALRQSKATMTKALNERDLDTIVANVDPNVVFTHEFGDRSGRSCLSWARKSGRARIGSCFVPSGG